MDKNITPESFKKEFIAGFTNRFMERWLDEMKNGIPDPYVETMTTKEELQEMMNETTRIKQIFVDKCEYYYEKMLTQEYTHKYRDTAYAGRLQVIKELYSSIFDETLDPDLRIYRAVNNKVQYELGMEAEE